MEQHYDDTFLARWLADELTAEELQEFKNSEDYQKYAQIVDTLETAEMPEFDVEENLQATLNKLSQGENLPMSKKKGISPLLRYAVAASIVLAIIIYSVTNYTSKTTYYANLGDKVKFELPDGSKVYMNPSSSVSYLGPNWDENREVELKGEAYFKVNKGSTFTVNTDQGNVTVLGTQFIVNARENFYNVICYEGKVQVVSIQKDTLVLTKGMAFLIDKTERKEYSTEETEPSWINDESNFKDASIDRVLEELERQFDITILGKENLKPALFTGRFSHKDATLAVQTIFMAMEIPYTTDANGNVVIQKY